MIFAVGMIVDLLSRAVLAVAGVAAFAATAFAQQPVPVRSYESLAIAPAGDRIAAIEGGLGSSREQIVVRTVGNGAIVRVIDGCRQCRLSSLAFSAGGDLAFLQRDILRQTVTLTIDHDGHDQAVATIAGVAQSPRFSPDGRRIAVLITIGNAREVGATQPGVRLVGEIGGHVDEQQLAVFAADAREIGPADVRPLSPPGRYIYEYDWTPDGRTLVVTSAIGNGDANWWVATLDAVDAATGAIRPIARPTTQIRFPRVSPDGASVAYVGGLMSDFGSVGGDVWTVPLAGGTPTDRTAGRPMSVTSLAWPRGGLRGVALHGERMGLYSATGDQPDGLGWSREATLAAGEDAAVFSADGRTVATVVQDWTHGPAIHAGPVDDPPQVTHDNDALPAAVTARSVTWHNQGFTVQGWLLSPLGADGRAALPMITVVHGGPAAAHTPEFVAPEGYLASFVAAGYAVFLPNPRGSYGQGEAFTAANRRDFGGGDLRDILAGIDAVERVAPIDDARLGLTGGSYGGFIAMWANTQTSRFRAIVAGAGIANWISYYGTNGIDQWMLPYFGRTLYQDPAIFEASSAIYHIATARTPTFLYSGERDIEVPPTQSIEYLHALRDHGVDASLVIYPDEGHGIRDPGHYADARARTVAWFDRYLAPARR